MTRIRTNRRSENGRNAPCFCGSGKKRKKCHDSPDAPTPFQPLPGAELKGTLLGKPIVVTRDPRTTTIKQLHKHLAQFNLAWTLRRLGELAEQINRTKNILYGIPIAEHCLAFLALAAIESSNDLTDRKPTMRDIVDAAGIFNCLEEPEQHDEKIYEFLIRMGYAQFSRPNFINAIARTWLIFGEIWPVHPRTLSINLDESIRRECGLTLRQMFALGLAYAGRSRAGYWLAYSDEELAMLPADLKIESTAHRAFIDWLSASYRKIRELASAIKTDASLAQYRMNPLLIKPVIIPDVQPLPNVTIYLTPSPMHVIRRLTDGLYHSLSFGAQGDGGKNAFKTAFGAAFQEYVGRILRAGCGDAIILPEWSYGPKKRLVDTPDWMILDGDTLVVVEVKQSSVSVAAKMEGHIEQYASDLSRTLHRAVEQLVSFERALSARAQGLERLFDISQIERLVVTYESLPWSNWLTKEAVARNAHEALDTHFCSVEDLENIQRHTWGSSLFNILRTKRASAESMAMDFRDWLFHNGQPRVPKHPLLADTYVQLFKGFGG